MRVSLRSLNPEELEVVRKSIIEARRGLDRDYETRIGVAKEQCESLLEAWPNVDDSSDDSEVTVLVNNSLNDLLHGIGLSEHKIEERIGCSRDEMLKVYRKWATSRGWASTGVR